MSPRSSRRERQKSPTTSSRRYVPAVLPADRRNGHSRHWRISIRNAARCHYDEHVQLNGAYGTILAEVTRRGRTRDYSSLQI